MSRTREERRRDIAQGVVWFASVLIIVCVTGGVVQRMDKPAPIEVAAPQMLPAPIVVEESREEAVELSLLGTFKATAYCPCVKCCGIWSAEHPSRGEDFVQYTASGTVPEQGRTIAADWGVLPEGSEVIIDGHTYTVEDTGSGITGKRIDVFFDSHSDALEWGVQDVEIYTIKV